MAEYIDREALLQQLEMAIECKDCPRNVDRKTYYDRCACSEIQDICDAITEAPKADVQPVDSWISVNDRLPEAVEEDVNGKIAFSKSVLVYLVYDNGFTYITNDRFRVDSKSWLHEIPGEGCKVTHWMPLPEPPKDGDSNG